VCEWERILDGGTGSEKQGGSGVLVLGAEEREGGRVECLCIYRGCEFRTTGVFALSCLNLRRARQQGQREEKKKVPPSESRYSLVRGQHRPAYEPFNASATAK
jgi:hypothetical protein